jgi:prolyl-tRNA editing enzyme YbaK/EbsC (Cys-tRNA(Pro) deacylase)
MDWMHVSGGERGINIKLQVKDFIKITNARIAAISKPKDGRE